MTKRATNSKLSPGKNSIDRVTPKQKKDEKGRPHGPYYIRWRICLPDGRVEAHRSQGRTAGEARENAFATARDIVATSPGGNWKPSSSIVDYIDAVSVPAVATAKLADNSKTRYGVAIGQWKAELKGHTIASATRFRVLESALKAIANRSGSESARQCRTVWGKYIAQQLVRDELLAGNPLAGMSMDLSSTKPVQPRAERSLTREELNAAIDWLMSAGALEGAHVPTRGRWRDAAAAKRRNLVDLALLQAASGLRVSEANALTWDVFDRSADITKSNTRRGRVVPLLFGDVVEHLARRRSLGGTYVIGAPSDGSTQWDEDACRKANADFYPEIAAAIDCHEVFDHGRTHIWGETLNSLVLDVPVEVRAAYFGHSTEINRRYYTDTTDVRPVVEAAKKLRH